MSVIVTIVDDTNIAVAVTETSVNVSVSDVPGTQGPEGPQGPQGPPGAGGVWGGITGTLSDQTDLQGALDLKVNTSELVNYQATSLMSNYQLSGNYLTTAMQSGASTQFVQANAAFNGTNISGTIASSGISLSVNPGGLGADGFNRIAAGTQTAGTLATVVFSDANNVSFGMNNSSVITASMSQSVQTQGTFNTTQLNDYRATSLNSELLFTSVSSQFALTANDSLSLGTIYTTHTHNYQAPGAYLTTARASNDAIGLNTALTANGVQWTVNSSGLSLNVPAFLTTAMQSASSSNFAGTGSAITNGTMTYGTGGLSLNLSNHLTTAMASNAGSNFVAATAAFAGTNASGTIASNGISVSVAAPGAAAENNWVNLLGANTAGNTTASGSTVAYSGINLTLSGTNGSVVNFSAPATSSLSGTGLLSISVNASTISLGVAETVLSRGIFAPAGQISSSGMTNSQMSFRYFSLPAAVSFTRVDIPMNVSITSSATANTANIVFTSGAAIYSLSGSTLNPIVGNTNSTTYTFASNTANYSSILGGRYASFPLATKLPPGEYWLGVFMSTTNNSSIGTATTQIANTISVFFGSFLTAQNFAEFGATTGASSVGIVPLQGCVSLSISNTTMTFQQSQITASGTAGVRGNIWFNLKNI